MRRCGGRHRNFIRIAAPSYQWTDFICRLRFICSRYAPPRRDLSNSYVVGASYLARREAMLDLALFFGFALLCVYITYERLCNRW
jgi:hypothetical protein